jgi:hypothetical protein
VELIIKGYPLSNCQKKMIQSAVNHALDYLVSKRMKNTLEICIIVKKDLYQERLIWGDMNVEDEECRSPKIYDIRLSYSGVQSFGQLIKVLCHETVHVAQFATRRMRHLSASFGVRFGREEYSSDVIQYDDRPWEIEALALEDEIFAYVREKDETIENYIQAKSCDSWQPVSNFLASEL